MSASSNRGKRWRAYHANWQNYAGGYDGLSKILAAANARASSSNKSSDKEIDVSDSRYKALTRAFAQIDADILRTSARRLNGPAKRGGKLAGVTISSNAISSNSKGLMESMVSAALEGGIRSCP